MGAAKTTALRRTDTAALCGWVAFALWLFWLAQRPPTATDEAFYLTIPHRLLLGDRLLLDDWHISQLSAVFQYPFVWAFYQLTGGTAGIVLFMRRVYIVLHLGFSAYFYTRLRRFGRGGLLAAALYLSYQPLYFLAVSYNSVCLTAFTFVTVTAFTEERRTVPKWIAVGVAFACGVIAEPLTAALYLLYSICVLIFVFRKRQNAGRLPLCGGAAWGCVTGGAALCAGLYLLWLGAVTDLTALPAFVRRLLQDPTLRTVLLDGKHGAVSFGHLWALIQSGGAVFPALAAVLTGIVCADKKRDAHRTPYLIAALVLLSATAAWYCFALYRTLYFFDLYYFLLPFFLFGGFCGLLTQKKDKRLLAFWGVGVLLWLIWDVASESTSALGAAVGMPAAVLLAQRLWLELRDGEGKKKHQRFPASRLVAGSLVPLLLLETVFCVGRAALRFPNQEQYRVSADRTATAEGPWKGVRTGLEYAEAAMRRDLDRLKEMNGADAPVYIADQDQWMYLYLDLPYACSATWLYGIDETMAQQAAYWSLYPEKRPRMIYLPYTHFIPEEIDGEQLKAALRQMCAFEVLPGEGGEILRVTDWHLTAKPGS